MVKAIVIGAVVMVSAAAVVVAQQSGFSRTILQTVDISVPERQAVTGKAEFATAGATVGKHTHPGEEIGYILEGTLTIDINGTVKTLKAGETFAIPANTVHNATNAGPGKAAIVSTYIVEKGKPLATPVK